MSLIKNLHQSYRESSGSFELSIPELFIPSKGVTALSGPSGSGKSTLLRILSGLEPCSGFSWVDQNVDLALLSPAARNIGLVFQDFLLFPNLTARENIEFASLSRRQDKGEFSQRLKILTEGLSLSSIHLNQRPSTLSGGEQQRVAIARALISKPRFLFLDEPFSQLDIDLRRSSRNMVRELIRSFEIPTVLVSHDQEDIEALAHRVYFLENGKVQKFSELSQKG